ncbi:hypothetical protein [Nitrospira sp. BLG_2]|uniref:hypothetical protein n=1 Tax=Nitrospira sp. BLG_2 TaxID=3397507 RepID=UPI003B9AB13C
MPTQHGTDHRLMEIIIRAPGSAFDDIVLECPDLTWNQVFLTIDRLTREGAMRLTPKGGSLYSVSLSPIAPT